MHPNPVTFLPSDFVILTPNTALALGDPDIPPNKFYLAFIISNPDNTDTLSFEILLAGPCALVEAIAISAARKGQRIWFPHEPFGPSDLLN